MRIYYPNAAMTKRLSIVIFDGTFKTTPFINRLIVGLSCRHMVYVLGQNEQLDTPLAHVRYVSIGSNANRLRFVATSLSLALKQRRLKLLATTVNHLVNGHRAQLQKQNLTLLLQRIQPDIIHLQWPSVIPLFEAVLEAQQVPVVLSQRGYHVNVRPFVDTENFNYLQTWYPKIAGFHSVSKAVSSTGDAIYTAASKIDHVVYSGLALDDFPFQSHFDRHTPLRLLSVGRPHWKKGYDYAIRACHILRTLQIPFSYTIIGGAQDEELLFLIDDLKLKDSVQLKPNCLQTQVYSLMKEYDVLVLPSVEEGIANVAIEAMALGLPVISTRCGGMAELIHDCKTGWLVPTRDPRALAKAIGTFTEMAREDIDVVRYQARQQVEAQHREEHMVHGMEALYLNVVSKF